MIELKPCPFCGGVAFNKGIVDKDVGLGCWWIECAICESCGKTGRTSDEAAMAWNRRIDDEESHKAYFEYCDKGRYSN